MLAYGCFSVGKNVTGMFVIPRDRQDHTILLTLEARIASFALFGTVASASVVGLDKALRHDCTFGSHLTLAQLVHLYLSS